jgi:hypothetical protein
MPLTVTITGFVREPNNGRVLLDYTLDGERPNGKEFANQASALEWVRSGLDDLDEAERETLGVLLLKMRILRAIRAGTPLTQLIGKSVTFNPNGNPILGVT